jgi:hypothetical protein
VPLLRIREAMPMEGCRLRLTLTDGSTVERDIADLLMGPMFEAIRKDAVAFRQVTVEAGTVVWPNGADLCPDVLIWGGTPPKSSAVPPQSLTLKSPSLVR